MFCAYIRVKFTSMRAHRHHVTRTRRQSASAVIINNNAVFWSYNTYRYYVHVGESLAYFETSFGENFTKKIKIRECSTKFAAYYNSALGNRRRCNSLHDNLV